MKAKPVLKLCGLGTHPPEETTLEVLQSLEDSRVVFCDIRDPGLIRWLRDFCGDIRELGAGDAAEHASRVLKQARRAGTVSVAVWGHPMLTSPLSLELLKRARGLDIRIPAAVSPIGSAFAKAVRFFGGDYGYHAVRACDLKDVSRKGRLDTAMPLVVYCGREGESDSWRALAASASKDYPHGHRCFFFPVSSGRGGEIPLARLAKMPERASRAVLLLPPAGAQAREERH